MANNQHPSDIRKRRSDKQVSINLMFSIASFLILLVFTWVIGTMSSRMDRIEKKTDSFVDYYIECKEEIQDIRKDFTENMAKIKDQIIDLFKKKT